ncbi:hypothetical protein AVL61_11430 [Kocuria rosea subsp. polaris]|uniref:Lipoprotein n=1 Tax=Kocuria rosea subsp. polaris TaxID=136273 RepID=A0A0W8IPN1_KOCRO|nr:hypothetical protein [Kocuria polaris]KUG61924.1 hypothetical protein AVL61_11430 [Kocuria polaris]
MSTKAVVTSLFIATGLALAGCAGDPPAQESTPAARTSPSPSDTVRGTTPEPTSEPATGTTPAPTPEPTTEPAPEPDEDSEPQPEDAPPAAEEPGPADPWAAFAATPEGQPYTGTVTRVEQQAVQGGGLAHRLTADTNDRAVAVEICGAYQSAMGTGQDRIDVVDTVGQLLAFAPGGPGSCQVQVNTDVGAVPFPEKFSYDEALAAWRSGVPYYDAFCVNYDPVTEAGVAQCTGIENGTVDSVTGEYIGG